MYSLYAVFVRGPLFECSQFRKATFLLLFCVLAISTGKLSAKEWDNIYQPPKLNNPIVIRTAAQLTAAKMVAYNLVCAGDIYRVRAGARDVYIDLSGQPPIKIPLLIESEGNVIVRGVTIELEEQPGCGPGMLPNKPEAEYPNSNVKARPPTGRAVGISVKGIAWLEGLHIKFGGQNGDCVVWNAPRYVGAFNDYNLASAYFFVNSRCDNYDGHGVSEIGDSLHADLFQNQVGAPGELYFENVVAVSGNEGIINHPGTRVLGLRNFSYIEDTNYQEGPVSWGPLLATHVPDENLKISNVWDNAPGPSVWGPHNGPQPANWRFVPWNARKAGIPAHPEITAGIPPADFAPHEHIGEYYSTPFLVYHSDGSTSPGPNTSSASRPSPPTIVEGSVE